MEDRADGWFEGHTHVLPVRVYYADTDAGGVVYHSTYLDYAERARTEFMRAIGTDHRRLLTDEGLAFAVVRVEADFHAPARLDDRVIVRSRVTGLTGARISMSQRIEGANDPLVTLKLTLACMSMAGRAMRLPRAVRAALAGLVEDEGTVGRQWSNK